MEFSNIVRHAAISYKPGVRNMVAMPERCLNFAFEESQSQITRNMKSIGIDIGRWVNKGLLSFKVSRPTLYGLEMHLTKMHKDIEQFKPTIVVVDPITSLLMAGNRADIQAMLMRLLDHLKSMGVTVMLATLTGGGNPLETTDYGVSSLVDTWISLRDLDNAGERNRTIHIVKSRGMSHSNQVREFLLTHNGIDLVDVYTGSGLVLTGTARIAQEAESRATATRYREENDLLQRTLERKQKALEARVEAIRAEFDADALEMSLGINERAQRETHLTADRDAMIRVRQADAPSKGPVKNHRSGKNSTPPSVEKERV